jgi:hypothetical protein
LADPLALAIVEEHLAPANVRPGRRVPV